AYLLWRAFRYQKELTALSGGPVAARAAAAERRATHLKERGKTRQRGKAPAPVGPPPSKRYTPPKPTRPRPPAPS
ncbi:MAG: hypothetical protein ACYDB3_09390, partial [Acidimicrobiales bacterium]